MHRCAEQEPKCLFVVRTSKFIMEGNFAGISAGALSATEGSRLTIESGASVKVVNNSASVMGGGFSFEHNRSGFMLRHVGTSLVLAHNRLQVIAGAHGNGGALTLINLVKSSVQEGAVFVRRIKPGHTWCRHKSRRFDRIKCVGGRYTILCSQQPCGKKRGRHLYFGKFQNTCQARC